MTQEFSLTEGKISTTLLRFAPPFLLASFLQALYGAADLYVVGRFDTAAGVSAVALAVRLCRPLQALYWEFLPVVQFCWADVLMRQIPEERQKQWAPLRRLSCFLQ